MHVVVWMCRSVCQHVAETGAVTSADVGSAGFLSSTERAPCAKCGKHGFGGEEHQEHQSVSLGCGGDPWEALAAETKHEAKRKPNPRRSGCCKFDIWHNASCDLGSWHCKGSSTLTSW